MVRPLAFSARGRAFETYGGLPGAVGKHVVSASILLSLLTIVTTCIQTLALVGLVLQGAPNVTTLLAF